MKKIVILCTLLAAVTSLYAQVGRKVSESTVAAKHVKDFQHQVSNPTDVQWYSLPNEAYRVDFTDAEGDAESMLFTTKGTETHYHIPANNVPAFVNETLKTNPSFKDYQLERLYARKVKNNVTYQARIVQKRGILWWRHVTASKLVNFEVSGKFIDAIDE